MNLTKDQLEVVNHYKSKYGIDITNGWFVFDIQDGEDDFEYFVCIQPKADSGYDQDSMCESFLPKGVELDYYCETIYGYDGDKATLIDSLEKTGFFFYIQND